MKRFKKAMITGIMAALLCAGTIVPVFAAEAPQEAPKTYVAYEDNGESISPYMKYLLSVSSSVTPGTNKVSVSGAYSSLSDCIVELSVSLQYSSDGSTWKTLESWSRTYDPGKGSNVLGRTYLNASKGYQYRNKTVATVKDSAGKSLESAVVFSKVISY